jgi:hypothetical protein
LWFAKQNIDSRIILFWNYPTEAEYKNAKYIYNYRSNHQDRYFPSVENTFILECLEKANTLLQVCIPYVNEVYVVNSGKIETSLVPLILERNVYNENHIPTTKLLISGSTYDLSYVNYGFTILSPRSRKRQAIKITKQNVIEVMKFRHAVTSVISAPSEYVEFINALVGDTERNITKIAGVGVSTILKMISKAIDGGLITESNKNIDMLSGILREDIVDIFRANYHCTNLEYQYLDLEPLDYHTLSSQIVDKYDDETLRVINEQYFHMCPIEIISPRSDQLLYDTSTTGKSIFA